MNSKLQKFSVVEIWSETNSGSLVDNSGKRIGVNEPVWYRLAGPTNPLRASRPARPASMGLTG